MSGHVWAKVQLVGRGLPPDLQVKRRVSLSFDHDRIALVNNENPQWHYMKVRWWRRRSWVWVTGAVVEIPGTRQRVIACSSSVHKRVFPGDTFEINDIELAL